MRCPRLSLALLALLLVGIVWSSIPVASALNKTLYVSTLAGNPTWRKDGILENARFQYPTEVSWGSDGSKKYLFYAGESENVVRRITLDPYNPFVETIAGTGMSGYRDGPGAQAQFSNPVGTAWNPISKVLYVADFYNQMIRVVNMTNTTFDVSTLAGSGEWGSQNGSPDQAQFKYPQFLVFDSTRNMIYVSDYFNYQIRAVNADTGYVSSLCGVAGLSGYTNGYCTIARMNVPWDLALDGTNSALYFTDDGSHIIRRINLTTNNLETVAGTPGSSGLTDGSPGKFSSPRGLTVNSAGTFIYVADTLNNRIRLIDRSNPSNPVVSTLAGRTSNDILDGGPTEATFFSPSGMTIDATNNDFIYFVDYSTFRVREFYVPGNATRTLNGPGFYLQNVWANFSVSQPQFSFQQGIFSDPSSGGIFVADMYNQGVRAIYPDEQIVDSIAGCRGVKGMTNDKTDISTFSNPTGVVVNSTANVIYVADRYNHCIRKIDRNTDSVSTIQGICGSTVVLGYPFSVTLVPGGDSLLIADTAWQCIERHVFANGDLQLVAGSYPAGATDGNATSQAKFNNPYHVCIDSHSDIYVADYGNNRIRKISGGIVSTVAGSDYGYVDGPIASAQFRGPSHVVCDESSGELKLWVADSKNHAIRLISMLNGVVSTLAGGNGFGQPGYADAVGPQALFRVPISIALDPVSQILFISDSDNTRIRTFGRPYLQPTPSFVLESNATTITIQGKGFCFTNCSLNTVSFSQSVGSSLHCARIVSCSYSNIVCELGGVGILGSLNASVSVSQFGCPVVGDSNLELVAEVMPMHLIAKNESLLAQNASVVYIHGKFPDLELSYYEIYLSSGACSITSVWDENTIACEFSLPPDVGPLEATVSVNSGNCSQVQVATIVPPPSIAWNDSKLADNANSITISGANFAALPQDNMIVLAQDGGPADPHCDIVEGSTDYIVCSNLTGISPNGTGQLSAIVMSNGGMSTSTRIATVVQAPVITASSEQMFLSDEAIFINGDGFSPIASENQIALFQPGQTEALSCTANETTQMSIYCTLDQPLIIGPLSAIVYVYHGNSNEVQIATVVPDPTPTSSPASSLPTSSASESHVSSAESHNSGHQSSGHRSSGSHNSGHQSSGHQSGTSSSEHKSSAQDDAPGFASALPFLVVSFGLLIFILITIIVIIVVVIVLIVLISRNSRHRSDMDAVELVDTTTVPTLSVIPTSDVLWEFDDPEEEEEKEGRMQQKELSHISKRVKLTPEDQAQADAIVRSFSTSNTLPHVDIRESTMIRFVSIALVLLENVETRACGSELTCLIWGSFLTDEQRLGALRKYKLLFSLLQACVHLSEPTDWSFVDRLQRTMQSYNPQLAQAKYTLHEELGSGAFGSVFVANRQGAPQSERVAIKVIKFAKKGYDENSTEQLISLRKIKREIVIMSILAMDNNPWLIYFMGHQLEPMKVSIIMAMAKGNVKDVLAANRRLRKNNSASSSASGSDASSSNSSSVLLPFSSRLDIAIQVASALHYLHSFSIVHRDLKSENILVMNRITTDNLRASVRLIDFGISRTTSEAESTFVTGTISWMAPEILESGESQSKKIELTTQCDVYSFGYLLWTLLTEREPHSSYAHSIESVKRAVIANSECPLPIPPPNQLPDFVGASTSSSSMAALPQSMYESYCRLLMACWRKIPQKRPTMSSVLDDLRKIQSQLVL